MTNIYKIALAFLFLLLPFGYTHSQDFTEKRHNVGDIPFDPATDNPEFEVGDELRALPYNTRCGMDIEGEKYRIDKYFADNYKNEKTEGQNGYITIRFLVNYKGETDRFRVYEMDREYHPVKFNNEITSRLLSLTKAIKGWKTLVSRNIVHVGGLPVAKEREHPDMYDYYQYITFKLKDGLIETILP